MSTINETQALVTESRDPARAADESFIAKHGNGLIVLSVWKNEAENGRLYFSWKAQLKYRDAGGQTKYIGTSDEHMPTVAAMLLQQAWPWCGEQRKAAADAKSE